MAEVGGHGQLLITGLAPTGSTTRTRGGPREGTVGPILGLVRISHRGAQCQLGLRVVWMDTAKVTCCLVHGLAGSDGEAATPLPLSMT